MAAAEQVTRENSKVYWELRNTQEVFLVFPVVKRNRNVCPARETLLYNSRGHYSCWGGASVQYSVNGPPSVTQCGGPLAYPSPRIVLRASSYTMNIKEL